MSALPLVGLTLGAGGEVGGGDVLSRALGRSSWNLCKLGYSLFVV
ncbi:MULTISPECIES: hypothetical protein [Methylobacterium]|jgi:hypothetical protein|uniref:Uncharacterized protein n=1 Tax=Methylobacterium longum TaxID=767694 RepID=A0ABT8AYP7_9HYPH|nr:MULTISPECIES: hypothetical protein [Methylobacterium]MDN3574675.1 hypothetical protein [Methylobacterium longum]GJE13636.1 hypothetical protein FOHLNKBM_4700 [Methylobacterium longum]